MLRALAETGEELDGQEVQKPLDEAAYAVFRMTESAGPMLDHDFGDLEAPRRGQHRDKAMELAIEADLAENRGPVAFHAAVVVMELDAGEPANEAVEDAAGPNFVPGVVARLLPAADDIHAQAQCQQKAG